MYSKMKLYSCIVEGYVVIKRKRKEWSISYIDSEKFSNIFKQALYISVRHGLS